MNSITNDLLAERYLGIATTQDYVDWATDCLRSHIDSKNIRILGSLNKPFSASEVEDYFNRSLKDLGWRIPQQDQCLHEYAQSLANRIWSGSIPPVEGCTNIYRVIVALAYPRELMSWVFLEAGLEPGTYSVLRGNELDQAILREASRFAKEPDIGKAFP